MDNGLIIPQGLTVADTRMLFALIITDEGLFRRAKEVLADKPLGDENAVYGLVLEDTIEYWDKHHSLPPLDILRSNLQADLAQDLAAVEDDAVECSEVLAVAKSIVKTRRKDPQAYARQRSVGNAMFNTFVEEVFRKHIHAKIVKGDLSTLLVEAQFELRQAMASGNDRFTNPFLKPIVPGTTGRFTLTGNRLIDMYTGGTGPASGDVVGHAAARGGGKSSLINTAAVDVAANERIRAAKENRPPRYVYIFNYEMIEGPMTQAISYPAGIPRHTVDTFTYENRIDQFSTGRAYKDYEKKRFGSLIRKAMQGKAPYPMAEFERFMHAREQNGQNLWIADLTGRDPEFAKMGTAFVDGVVDFIATHQLGIDSPGVEAVFLDYAGTMCRAHMRTLKRVGDSTERKLIEDLPFQLKTKIANPMRTWVWIAHQLAAVEAEKKGGTRPSTTKFKDCQSFAENCDYAIVNGKPIKETGLAIFVHSKSRRGSEQPDQIGRLIGEYCHWQPVETGYTIVNDQILSSKEASFIGGAGAFISPDED